MPLLLSRSISLAQTTVLSSSKSNMLQHWQRNRLGSAGPSEESAVLTVHLGEERSRHEDWAAHTSSYKTRGKALLWHCVCPALKCSAVCCPSRFGWLPKDKKLILERSQMTRGNWPSTFLCFLGDCRATTCHNCLQMLGLFSLPVHCVKRLMCFDLQFARGLQLPWEKQNLVHSFRSAQVEEMATAEFYCSLLQKQCS